MKKYLVSFLHSSFAGQAKDLVSVFKKKELMILPTTMAIESIYIAFLFQDISLTGSP